MQNRFRTVRLVRKTTWLLALFCLPADLLIAQTVPDAPVILILGAFDEEVRLLQSTLAQPAEQRIRGVRVVSGLLRGRRVAVAETGVGKTNAAMTTALLVQAFSPREVLFTGIAGGLNPDLQPGDIVIARQVAHHDFTTVLHTMQPSRQTRNPVDGQLNPEYFPADSLLLIGAQQAARTARFDNIPLTRRPPQVVLGVVVTGDVFVSSSEKVRQLRRDFHADATEMEGAAVAQVCRQLAVPCLVIRSLSDKADENARGDMMAFYKTAARNSAALVTEMVGRR